MIPVRETSPGVFERVIGNPILLSLDGNVRAPLQTILSPGWTDAERAAFGVYLVDELDTPSGKRVTARRYERQGDKVVQVLEVEDIPEPGHASRTPQKKVEAMAARFGLTLDELRSVLIQDGKQ